MASGFCRADDATCEGCKNDGKPHVTYRVEVKQKLCDDCAHDHQGVIKGAGDSTWFCDKHRGDRAKIYCSTHSTVICEACAIMSHQGGCNLIEVGDALKEKREQLSGLLKLAQERDHELKEHTALMADRVAKIQGMKEKEKLKLKAAHEEEIRKLNNKYESLTEELDARFCRIDDIVEKLTSPANTSAQILAVLRTQAGKLAIDDDQLLKDSSPISKAVSSCVDYDLKKIDKSILDTTAIAEKVRFGRRDGGRIGQIEVPVEEWKHETEFRTGIVGRCAIAMGHVGPDDVVIKNDDDHVVYMVNLKNKRKKKVVKKDDGYDMWQCSSLKDGRIVFGTCDGEVVFLDQSQKRSEAINVFQDSNAPIFVSANDDGMVLATALGASTIKVLHPDTGVTVKEIVRDYPIYGLHCLSSGRSVILTECVEGIDVCVINGEGATISSSHLHGEGVKGLTVDRSSDLIYCLIWDRDRDDYAVDVMSAAGDVMAKRVVRCEPSFYTPTCIMPESGKLVIHCDGKLVVYQKLTQGYEELLSNITA